MRRILCLIILSFYCCAPFAQTISNPIYPRNYFRSPVDIPLEIVANMGELRPNHWHMGLDIRTDQKENKPVYAAAQGFISHIGVRPSSFGRYIIIDHPNGLSTLYAHLNDFFPALEEYVTREQYRQERWAIELDLTKEQFPVSKGQFIAYSGNTGGSQGPHVHFEIMNSRTKERLNPLLFGFPLKDEVPPTLVKLAMYDRSKSVFVQSPVVFNLKKTDSGYIIPKTTVLKTGIRDLSFGIQAYDRISGSSNADGIFEARLSVDDIPQVRFVIDSIDYDETRYMNAHIDYRHRFNGGAFFQHLSQLPGDEGNVYRVEAGDGVISLDDTLTHTITIDVVDAYDNASRLSFLLQYDDSLVRPGEIKESEQLLPGEVNVIEKPAFEAYLPAGSLYDRVPLRYFTEPGKGNNAVSAVHQLNDESYPLHEDIRIRIRPDRNIPADWKNKLVIQQSSRGKSTRRAELQGDWVAARFDDFGKFQVFADIEPPKLNELGRSDTVDLSPASRILFTPTDDFGIKSFRAELNGEWLRFTNDKGRNHIYIFDERVPFGTYHLKVTVEDLVGNTTTKSWWFKRGPYTPPKKKAVKKKSKKKTSSKKPVAKKKR